ncbi:hypothetical protein BC834DRAFT_276017 [Gloeopeniophorella convolvens]|nr:hypothetical protein BC834DRAFT_276017 [Gloeopeniophorella convolvens]
MVIPSGCRCTARKERGQQARGAVWYIENRRAVPQWTAPCQRAAAKISWLDLLCGDRLSARRCGRQLCNPRILVAPHGTAMVALGLQSTASSACQWSPCRHWEPGCARPLQVCVHSWNGSCKMTYCVRTCLWSSVYSGKTLAKQMMEAGYRCNRCTQGGGPLASISEGRC